MTAYDFIDWLDLNWLSDSEAAKRLFVSVEEITRFKYEGANTTIALACGAIAAGVPPWAPKRKSPVKRRAKKAA
ncbi:hypothetical protein [Aurantimonas coralicida]|uniref:XRE family transcriptional regulator n=1 Tax=Aurantimonas coralicida TaxID=182270 RepID=A0A0P0YZ80_9HYPH|nr:hypothetical protein [Aurantimonas coralicida]BAT26866.1 hypothetical protein [Aurantimonas coralicida]